MKVIAEQKNIRMSARKARLVVDAIKHISPQEAIIALDFMPKRAAEPVQKVLKQAVANATENLKVNPIELKISEILVNEGPTIKRWRAVSRGRAHSILKRTCHIKFILETKPVNRMTAPAKKTEVKTEVKTKTAKETTISAKPNNKQASSKSKTTKK